MEKRREGPLAGIRIIDMTSVLMGPFATQILADYGADVIKVESPDGDLMRLGGAMRNPGMGALYLQANRNKRSVVLDVKSPRGREALLRLCKTGDVFVHNVRMAAMRRANLTYEAIRAVKDDIIYLSLMGYGEDGPYAGWPAYDDLIQGISGVSSLFAIDGKTEPRYVPLTMADRIVGINAAHAILAALVNRERGGGGQSVDVPMFETMAQFVLGDHLGGLTFDPPTGPPGYNRLVSPDRRPLKTKDGYLCVLVYTDRHWERFFAAIGKSEVFRANPVYHDHATRTKNYDRVYADLAAYLAERTTAEWISLFNAHDIPCVPMHNIESLLRDPHIAAVGLVEEVDHPTEGRMKVVRPPAKWSGTPPGVFSHAPNLGEHTAEVLAEIGYGPGDISEICGVEEGLKRAQ